MTQASQKAIKSAGMRVTSQRAIIMEIIRQGHGHLDADDIFRQARRKEPRISLSTVYRALRAFKEQGLVEELHLGDTHHRYEVKPVKEHHHLICLGCGKVIEFQHPLSSYLNRNAPEARNFDITEAELCVKGYCPECRQKKVQATE